MGHINLAYKCDRRSDGRWALAFQLTLIEGGEIRELPIMTAADLIPSFATKERAEAASDAIAREWCAKNYPGWSVQPT